MKSGRDFRPCLGGTINQGYVPSKGDKANFLMQALKRSFID
jgi:hypothetical protein